MGTNTEEIRGTPGKWHTARKQHRCDRYFRSRSEGCMGSGQIGVGERYWSPTNDAFDPFHPWYVCTACANVAKLPPQNIEVLTVTASELANDGAGQEGGVGNE